MHLCYYDSLLKTLLYEAEVDLIKKAGEGVKSIDCEVTHLGLSSNWMTMGQLFDCSKAQFSHLLHLRILFSQSCYKHQV